MADMRYYGNVMTTRWRLYVILHLQQYSRRLNLFFFIGLRASHKFYDQKEFSPHDKAENRCELFWTKADIRDQMKCKNCSLQKHCKWRTIILTKIKVDWDVTPYRLVNVNRRFGKGRCLQFQGLLFLGCYNLKMKACGASEMW